ncbi:hypothetical protein ABZ297_14035 [Nonomuraea sp. NPDC005983]|uniref:hypothetical protein n=1 Tax=Nonomuraea sp. NPDC005983 TaxID=3155595 RepID=UPI0033AC7530
MKRIRRMLLVFFLSAAALLVSAPAHAASGGGCDAPHWYNGGQSSVKACISYDWNWGWPVYLPTGYFSGPTPGGCTYAMTIEYWRNDGSYGNYRYGNSCPPGQIPDGGNWKADDYSAMRIIVYVFVNGNEVAESWSPIQYK